MRRTEDVLSRGLRLDLWRRLIKKDREPRTFYGPGRIIGD